MRARTRIKIRNRLFRTGDNTFAKLKSYALHLSDSHARKDENIFLFTAPLSDGWDYEFTLTSQPRKSMANNMSSHALTRKELTQLRDLFTRALEETEPKNGG
jgi:hypothetical protein